MSTTRSCRKLPDGKISETFLDFAAPILLHLPADIAVAEMEKALTIAFTVWNSVVFDHVEGGERHVAKVKACLSGAPRAAALVEELLERKRRLFGDDWRLVGEYHVVRNHGEWRLRAEVRDPYTAKKQRAESDQGTEAPQKPATGGASSVSHGK